MNKDWLKDLVTRPSDAIGSPLPTCQSSRSQIWGVALISSLLFAILYCLTVAPSLGMCHDTGELTTCCVIQGVPHSPGYPLFVALGWLANQMPVTGDPAYRINLLCALEVALAMGFLGAALALATRPWPALIATLLAGTCTAIWRQAVVTEVFALHLLFLCILIWLALLWEHSENVRRREILLVTSFILGLCLAHQHIIALAAPAFILFGAFAKGKGRAWGFSWLNVPILLAALVLPYALQWYFAHQSPALNWDNVITVERLKDHFLRKSYGTGLLNSAALEFDSRTGDAQVTAFFISLARSYYPFPAFLFIFFCLDRTLNSKPEPRVWLFLGIALLYGPYFGKLGNQPSFEFYSDMMERFYSSSMVGFAGVVAFGIDWSAYRLWPWTKRYLPVGLLLAVYAGVMNYPKSSQRDAYHAVDLTRAIFQQVPPRSAILVTGDLPAGASDYFHYALREHRNTIVILPGLATAQWYRDRLPVGLDLAAKKGTKEGDPSNEVATQRMVDYLESRGFNIFCNDIPPGLKGEFTRYGLLMRYRGKSTPLTRDQQIAELRRVFAVLEECPRRGAYKLDWKQNFWIRFCITEWIKGYRELAKAFSQVDPELASIAMDRVIEMESSAKLDSYLNRATLKLHLGRFSEAVRDYEVCLRIFPNSRLALQGMIEAQQGLKDKTMVERFQRRLQNLGPETPEKAKP